MQSHVDICREHSDEHEPPSRHQRPLLKQQQYTQPDFRDTADYTSARGRGRYGSMMLTWNGVLKKMIRPAATQNAP
jgi:hypothetical protein